MKATALLWAAFAVVAAFEAAVLVMIATPRVSADYHAFFIDRSTLCWPLDASGEIEPGREISFLPADRENGAQNVLECGWNLGYANGVWSNGPEARLRFKLPSGPARLAMSLYPYLTEEHPQQRVEVSAGRWQLARLVLTTGDTPRREVNIPPEAIEDGEVLLTLRFPDATSPREQGEGTDRRTYGVRLVSLRLLPAKE
jgi:hypothetical protein